MKFLRLLLLPLALIYATGVFIRNLLFDIKLFGIHKINTLVISIGNILAGGTGKTPIVEYIIKHLISQDKKVAVVSRGYKRTSKGIIVISDGKSFLRDPLLSGDEPLQIAQKFPQAIVVVGEDKYRAARFVEENFNPDVIILDDGFQHRSLYRNFDVVVLDNSRSKFDRLLLPAGYAREPYRALKRSNFVLFANGIVDEKLNQKFPEKLYASFKYQTTGLKAVFNNSTINLNEFYGKMCYVFCGIANPDSFFKSVVESGLHIEKFKKFPDHYYYKESDLEDLIKDFKESNCDIILTTEKDAVRLNLYKEKYFNEPIYYLKIEVKFLENENKFLNEINKLIKEQ